MITKRNETRQPLRARFPAAEMRADFLRQRKNARHRKKPGQLKFADRGEPRRGDASAFRAHRVAAELARLDARRQVGGDIRGGLREDAFLRRCGRMQVAVENDVGHLQFREIGAHSRDFAHHARAVGRRQALRGFIAPAAG